MKGIWELYYFGKLSVSLKSFQKENFFKWVLKKTQIKGQNESQRAVKELGLWEGRGIQRGKAPDASGNQRRGGMLRREKEECRLLGVHSTQIWPLDKVTQIEYMGLPALGPSPGDSQTWLTTTMPPPPSSQVTAHQELKAPYRLMSSSLQPCRKVFMTSVYR